MKKKVVSILMAAAMVLSLAACKGQSDQAKTEETAKTEDAKSKDSGDVKIAYIVKAMSDQFWIDMKEGADKAAEELGVVVDFQAPEKETDVEVQIQYVENAITSGYDAIVLSAADSKALNPSIVKANDAKIPVILVNDTIDMEALEADGGKVATYVGIDQYEAAALAGSYAVENVKSGKVALLEGIAGVDALDQRLAGFKDKIEESGDFEIVASQTANCDRNEAFNVVQNILTSNPDVNVIWAVNAEMGQGAIQAIEQSGKSGISVFDFDASDDDMETIENGTLVGSVAQYPDLQAKAAIQACLDVLDGKTLEEHTVTKAELITKDNI
ncbi:sugar ABC transporter substrate-binding protein [Ruminococcus sp. OA3]|uniref:sugar ABC transporter substrate-binding protein n=1 Tax=Ruminococcus sp. OA3 TaxID=2914164 RepID=UPI001F06224C|nr:sugar ABC transporter substrate-binding protein [Ruminococcus sp. OA3]MCH1982075.1 sugar ABC transporter substrate-binding protein [Ruminococcus sp. OA3]